MLHLTVLSASGNTCTRQCMQALKCPKARLTPLGWYSCCVIGRASKPISTTGNQLLRYVVKPRHLPGSMRTKSHDVTAAIRSSNYRSSCRKGILSRWLLIGTRKYSPILLGFAPFAWLTRKNVDTATVVTDAIPALPVEELVKELERMRTDSRNIITKLISVIWDAVSLTYRFWRLVFTFIPVLVLFPVSWCGQSGQRVWWRILMFAMVNSGPTYIKLGQWMGTRRDLFTAEFCDLFSQLHVGARVHSWFMTQRQLRKAFGRRWREIFVRVEKKPIGSGCIAQVHKAYMNANMVPDDILDDDYTSDDESDDPSVDFAEGMEIIGFGHVKDHVDDLVDSVWQRKTEGMPDSDRTTTEHLDRTSEQNDKLPDNESEVKTSDANPAASDQNVSSTENDDDLIPVAIKVLHPRVYSQVMRDLTLLRFIGRVVQSLVPSLKWISLRECIDEFADLMTQQVDLRFEAECLEQFVENFENVPFIRFPRPIRPYCKRNVLVETFEEGEPISNFLNHPKMQPEGLKEKLAMYGVDALLQMIFVDNLTHADLHPGNILVQNAQDYVPQDETKWMLVDLGDTMIVDVQKVESPLRLVLLDVGITSVLSHRDLMNFKDVFTAIVIGEGERVAELMLNHATHHECLDVDGFKKELGTLVMNARKETIKLGQVQVGQLLSDVFAVLVKYRVKMESNFITVVLAIFVLEGLGRSLDPQLDILERAKPILLS